jgi:hypothetical protein
MLAGLIQQANGFARSGAAADMALNDLVTCSSLGVVVSAMTQIERPAV